MRILKLPAVLAIFVCRIMSAPAAGVFEELCTNVLQYDAMVGNLDFRSLVCPGTNLHPTDTKWMTMGCYLDAGSSIVGPINTALDGSGWYSTCGGNCAGGNLQYARFASVVSGIVNNNLQSPLDTNYNIVPSQIRVRCTCLSNSEIFFTQSELGSLGLNGNAGCYCNPGGNSGSLQDRTRAYYGGNGACAACPQPSENLSDQFPNFSDTDLNLTDVKPVSIITDCMIQSDNKYVPIKHGNFSVTCHYSTTSNSYSICTFSAPISCDCGYYASGGNCIEIVDGQYDDDGTGYGNGKSCPPDSNAASIFSKTQRCGIGSCYAVCKSGGTDTVGTYTIAVKTPNEYQYK